MVMQKTILLATLLLSSTASAFMPVNFSPRNDMSLLARMKRRGQRRAPPVKEYKPPMNGEIPERDLRVVTPSAKGKDEPLGVMSRADALAKAKEMGGLDLILVNPNSDPPVCKIVNYSKYRYMNERKAKEVKKNSKASELKEVKMSYKIDVHDYDVRRKNALKFLKQGNRVKCTIMFKGREMQHDKLGFELLEKLAEDMSEICVKEGKPKKEGRSLSLIVSPRAEVLKLVGETRRAGEKAKKAERTERQVKKAANKAALVATSSDETEEAEEEVLSMQEEIDLDSDIESSLDDLFGSDDLTDDLFK